MQEAQFAARWLLEDARHKDLLSRSLLAGLI